MFCKKGVLKNFAKCEIQKKTPVLQYLYLMKLKDFFNNTFFHRIYPVADYERSRFYLSQNQEYCSTFSSRLHVFIFISNFIFHFSFSCLAQNYDFSLKGVKKLLSLIFKFCIQALTIEDRLFIDFIKLFVEIVLLVEQKWN